MEAEPSVTVTTEISSVTFTMFPVAEHFVFNDNSWGEKTLTLQPQSSLPSHQVVKCLQPCPKQ